MKHSIRSGKKRHKGVAAIDRTWVYTEASPPYQITLGYSDSPGWLQTVESGLVGRAVQRDNDQDLAFLANLHQQTENKGWADKAIDGLDSYWQGLFGGQRMTTVPYSVKYGYGSSSEGRERLFDMGRYFILINFKIVRKGEEGG